MKYCCTVADMEGTCYHELKKGEYDGEHWSKDSLLLEDDLLDDLELYDFLQREISAYDRWGITKVDQPQWNKVFQSSKQVGGKIEIVIGEINAWAQEAFKTEELITFLGV